MVYGDEPLKYKDERTTFWRNTNLKLPELDRINTTKNDMTFIY